MTHHAAVGDTGPGESTSTTRMAHATHTTPTTPAAILAAVHTSLQQTHVYVDPGLASQVTAAQLKEIEHDAATSPYPVYVVLFPYSDGDAFSGEPLDLLTRLHQTYPKPGLYLSSGVETTTEYGSIDVAAQSFGVPSLANADVGDDLPLVIDDQSPATLGAAFVDATRLVKQGPTAVGAAADRAMERYENSHPTTSTSTDDGSPSGSGGGPSAGAITVLVLVVIVFLVGLAVVVGRRRDARLGRLGSGRPTGGPTAFTLPASAMDRIREAHDRRLEEQARAELLALGETIDAHELPDHASATVTASWQAALDRYDAAGTVLDRRTPPDVLDVVGCLVLTRQGDAALTAALAGRRWTPEPTCYLDPLHGRASVQRVVDPGNGAAREVPLCADCRRAVDGRGGRTTPDILDVERHGRPVHYFDSGVEPWASTGYGCFGDDLLIALRRAS